MKFHGLLFTWCNKRVENELICKKLDRVLVNDQWIVDHQQTYGVFEAVGCSNHLRCRIQFGAARPHIRKPFKFTNVLAKDPDFLQMVKDNWGNTDALFHSTVAMYKFSKKLKFLKPKIKAMSKDKLGDLTKNAREAFTLLCQCQKDTLTNPSPEAMCKEATAYARWSHVSALEKKFLKQK